MGCKCCGGESSSCEKGACCIPRRSCTCCKKNEKATEKTADEVRSAVSNTYARFAQSGPKCCDCKSKKYAMSLGYNEEDLADEEVPAASLSCGNPVGLADLKEGETVMDLGCGTGFDCRLAARKVGKEGKVVGVDMTKEMLEKARELTNKEKYPHVSFHESTIEEIGSIEAFRGQFDAVLSNCVFNLSPEKEKVLSGVFAVLKPGGRLIFSDPVALRPIPEAVRQDMSSYTQCMANASSVSELSALLTHVGFERIAIEVKEDSSSYLAKWTPNTEWENGVSPKSYVATASIWAYKPL